MLQLCSGSGAIVWRNKTMASVTASRPRADGGGSASQFRIIRIFKVTRWDGWIWTPNRCTKCDMAWCDISKILWNSWEAWRLLQVVRSIRLVRFLSALRHLVLSVVDTWRNMEGGVTDREMMIWTFVFLLVRDFFWKRIINSWWMFQDRLGIIRKMAYHLQTVWSLRVLYFFFTCWQGIQYSSGFTYTTLHNPRFFLAHLCFPHVCFFLCKSVISSVHTLIFVGLCISSNVWTCLILQQYYFFSGLHVVQNFVWHAAKKLNCVFWLLCKAYFKMNAQYVEGYNMYELQVWRYKVQ